MEPRQPGSIALLVAAVAATALCGCGAATTTAAAREARSARAARSAPQLPPQRFAPQAPAAGEQRPAVEIDDASLTALLREQQQALAVPAIAAVVVGRGGQLWFGAAGVTDTATRAPITAETVFRIGSITKTFTGLALLLLRDEGRLQLDDPVARHLPEISQVIYPTRDSPRITVRQLLTHTSGLPRMGRLDYTPAEARISERSLLAGLAGLKLDSVPGTQTSYSNLAAGIAGLVVSRVSGLPYREFVTRRILQPLKMSGSGWDRSAVPAGKLATGYRLRKGALVSEHHWRLGASEALGGLYASAADMARYVAFQLSAWPPRSASEAGPVRRATVRESHLVAGFARPGAQTFGINWGPVAHPRLGLSVLHAGGTYQYSALVWLLPERGLGLVLLANSGGEQGENAFKLPAVAGKLLDLAVPARLSPALASALQRVRLLLDAPDPEAIRQAFAPSFLQAVPVERVAALLSAVRETTGRCGETSAHKVIELSGDRGAVVRLGCARGSVEVTVHLVAPAGPAIAGFGLDKPRPGAL